MRLVYPMLAIAVSALRSRGSCRSSKLPFVSRLMSLSSGGGSSIDPSQMGAMVTAVQEGMSSSETYLFGNRTSFSALGVLPAVEQALSRLHRPVATAIQAATFAQVLSRRDLVIAAETGAGKSLAFIGIFIDGIFR